MGSPAGVPNDPGRERRHDLDWLRAIAIGLLILYHAAMPFNEGWDWHIKNDEQSVLLLEASFFVSRWRMGLLFAVSGIGAAFFLRRASGREYLRDRGRRLVVPLLFSIVALVPPQVYLERTLDGVRYANYGEFLRTLVTGRLYPEGNLSYHHLWFVVYLLTYCALTLPFFLWLRTPRGNAFHARADAWIVRGGVFALALPIGLVYGALIQAFHGPQNIVNDWAIWGVYLLIFTFGYLIGNRPVVWDAIERTRRTNLYLAVGSYGFIEVLRLWKIEPPPGNSIPTLLYLALYGGHTWFWVAAILGFGRRHLNRPHPALRYVVEATYPVYILHQTILVALAFYVVRWPASVSVKFAVLVIGTLGGTMAIYHFAVRRFGPLRFLFGMRPDPTRRTSEPPSSV